MPQNQDLHVLGGVTPCQEHQPAEHPDHEEIDEANEHERRPYSSRSKLRAGFWHGSSRAASSQRSSAAHSCSLFGTPPGLLPAASAGAMYFRSGLRSTPRLCAISFFDRPACQCIKISATSITSNVLPAIGLPSSSRMGGRLLLLHGQVHHDTRAIPMGIT